MFQYPTTFFVLFLFIQIKAHTKILYQLTHIYIYIYVLIGPFNQHFYNYTTVMYQYWTNNHGWSCTTVMAMYSCEFVENHAFTSKYTLGIQRTSLGCTLGGTAGGSTEDPVEQTIMINIWDSSNFTHNIIVFNFTDNNTVIWMDPGRPQRYPRCITKNA